MNDYKDMNDTIAAISSGMTKSGIGVIRISGPKSRCVAEKILFGSKGNNLKLTEPSHIYYGFVKNVSRETSDEVLVLNMPGPHSFTGEDVVEIDCHGGILMMKRVLEAVTEAGARHAEPGEFTKRAFLNGRIDLSQAEAVINVINAENDDAIRASEAQLRGKLSDEIRGLRADILEKTAYIESALDDPEHYSLDGFGDEMDEFVNDLICRTGKLISSYSRGKLIENGVNTVIIGRPNAGKSSLMNVLLGEERAIVTQIPGTTRDIITEHINIGSVTLNLTDTAGIRESSDAVEKIGIQRARENADRAELILCVVDGSEALNDEDRDIIKFVSDKNCQKIYLINKSDVGDSADRDEITALAGNDAEILSISARNSDGIEELCRCIESMFETGGISLNDETVITSERHYELLKHAENSLTNLRETVDAGLPEDFYTVDMMDAYRALGEIIGEEVDEDLVNEIFSKFCMGK